MISTALLISSILLGATEDTYQVSVGPAEEDLAFAVVSVPVPASVDPTRLGSQVPFQVRQTPKGEKQLVWIVERLAKGSVARYSFKSLGRADDSPVQGFTVKSDGSSIHVEVAGKPFTTLKADPKEFKPYLYPIIVDGARITRHYPMDELAGEDHDHVHQRSFWFTHGAVNGVDFWSESNQAGKVIQRKVREASGGPVEATIATDNEWVAPDGKSLLADERVYRFHDLGPAGRMIDLEVILTARSGPVVFGDTKEGTFGIRMAESMKEERGGRIENSRGQVTEKEAWGKPAEWVDCSGPIDGKTFGIAILDHPTSFRHPTTWHVRGYGLFAANPFGLKEFTKDKSKDGSYRLENGMSMVFRYRVFFHPGAARDARVAEVWNGFAHPPKVQVLAPTGGKE